MNRFHEQVRRASRLREALFGTFLQERETDAYRLSNAEGDGVPGFLVDAYAGYLVVQMTRESAVAEAPSLEEALVRILKPHGIVRKLRYAEGGRGRVPTESTRGTAPPEVLTVRENGIPFGVELTGRLHTGLFSDMRDERLRLRQLARGRRVLNTFAYTGAFSVAAAVGGAREVTTVDVVGTVLERAKANFRLASLDPGAHRFVRMEVLEYLRLAKRRAWHFDAVVLDPPTFAAFKSGRWSSKTDYPELLELALGVLERGGLLWAAINTQGLRREQLERHLERAFRVTGRHGRILATGGLPADYPTPVDSPKSRYLKVFVLEVD